MKIGERVFTDVCPGTIRKITGQLCEVELDIKPDYLLSPLQTFHKKDLLLISEYEDELEGSEGAA